ncbi:hypothetical protein J4218_01470 [Candidatus Pacearchaeota archaeon]|nr:hypothetical protein [Candidatus Pacearchaeota archaeon]
MKKIDCLFFAFLIIIGISFVVAEASISDPLIEGTQIKFSDKVLVTWGTNVEPPATISDLNSFKVKSGGTLSVSYKGDSRTYGSLDGTKKNEFIFDKSGNMKEAYFTPSQNGKYRLGNQEFFVPAGADVIYKDGVATIKPVGEMKLEKPLKIESVTDASEDITLSYESDKGFTLENGDKFTGTLKYKEGFFFDSDAKIGSINVKNPEKVPTYIFYDGEIKPDLKAGYISINKEKGKLTVGCNIDVRGPSVKLDENNAFGVKIEKSDYFTMRPLGNSEGSYISIQNREKEGKVPNVETLNQFVMDEDGKSVYFNTDDGKLHLNTNGGLIEEFGKSPANSFSTPLEVHPYKTINGQKFDISKYKNVLGIGNQNNFGYGPDPKFIKTHVPDYYKQKKAPGLFSGFSNSLVYNYDQTLAGLNKFTGVSIVDKTGVTKDLKNIQMLMDIFAGIPTNNFKKWGLNQFIIMDGWTGWSGLADSDGVFYINVGNGGFRPSIIRHELTHIHDFTFGYNSKFNQEWRAIGGNTGPHTYDYGYTSAEDTSTFAEMVYRDDPWKNWLSEGYKYHDKFRARIAVFTKYGFMSQSEASRLFSLAGLPSDSASLERYIAAGKAAVGTLGMIIIFRGDFL